MFVKKKIVPVDVSIEPESLILALRAILEANALSNKECIIMLNDLAVLWKVDAEVLNSIFGININVTPEAMKISQARSRLLLQLVWLNVCRNKPVITFNNLLDKNNRPQLDPLKL
jgi:hypothetical protein